MHVALFLQISLYPDDDMLGIEPLELRFPFELQKQITREVNLTNKTKDYYAFNIEMPRRQYHIQPNKGIVSPQSNCIVQITLQAQESALQEMPYTDDFIVHSTKVDRDIRANDITEHVFSKETVKADEVNFKVVVYEPKKSQGNVSAESVSKVSFIRQYN
jgi:disease resistance protein RPM1